MRRGAALLLPVFLASCFFEFDRGREIGPGEISGRTVLPGGEEVAPFARITPLGTPRVRLSDDAGDFLLDAVGVGTWSLRFTHDQDGDGRPEHAAHRLVAVPEGPDGAAVGVLLGDVALLQVASLSGTATLNGAPAAGAQVVVYSSASSGGIDVELPIEARTATDSEGRFRIDAIAPGEMLVAAFTGESASTPVSLSLAENEDRSDVELTLTPSPTPRDVRVLLAPAPSADERVRIDLLAAGSAALDIDPSAVDEGENTFVGLNEVTVPADVGLHDVYVTTSTGKRGALLGQAVLPPGNDDIAWGLVLLTDVDPCAFREGGEIVAGARDCDGDALRGLPFDEGIFTECAPACTDAFGAVRVSCETPQGTFDCDDDGDGQPDVTAPLACAAVERGGDLDGDGVCDREDIFPDCAANDATDPGCSSERPPLPRPDVRPEFGGPPIDVDAGPRPDAGPDGGPIDAPLRFNVNTLDFGDVTERLARDDQVVLENTGSSDIRVTLAAPVPFEVLPPATVTLGPGTTRAFAVRFSPDVAGSASGDLTVTADAAGSTPTVILSGTGLVDADAADLRAARSAIDFGPVVIGGRGVVGVTLENVGAGGRVHRRCRGVARGTVGAQ